jgi:hypothetical protein
MRGELMDAAHPIRAIVPSLEGPVLEVLARTTRPLTGREVHSLAEVGSANGIRLALSRLVEQGVVLADHHASAVFYLANREHLVWPAVEILTGLRAALKDRIRQTLASWKLPPIHASLFGSAARSDGDVSSDIDMFLVRPGDIDEEDSPWAEQVDELRQQVHTWTGNRCQTFQLDISRLAEHARVQDPLIDNWQRDAITLAGPEPRVLLRKFSTTRKPS